MSSRTLLARVARLPTVASGPSRAFASASSTSAPFEPALPQGVDPAYDEALRYIEERNVAMRDKLKALRAKAGDKPTPEQAARIARLEVDAWVNNPATRRLFKSTGGKGHMDRPVMRSLAERQWRKEGELDLLMQRVYQLGVIPDLLPDHTPSVALRVVVGENAVEPGTFQSSSSFASPPILHAQIFHHPVEPSTAHPMPEAKYTLLMLDPDSPDHVNQAFSTRVHYAKADISLSVLSGEMDLFHAPGTELLPYEPPAPARGSGKHRFVFVLARQNDSAAALPPPNREDFDLRSFLTERELSDKDVVAATLFRAEWTQEDAQHVDETYQKHRGEPAPVYTKAPKELRYGYPMSAKAQRAEEIRQMAWDGVIAEINAMGQGDIPEGQRQ